MKPKFCEVCLSKHIPDKDGKCTYCKVKPKEVEIKEVKKTKKSKKK